jgi:preprotein translocase subunit SecE
MLMGKPKKAKKGSDEPAALAVDEEHREEERTRVPSISPRREPVKKARAQRSAVKERVVAGANNVAQFLREVRVELAKVTWPSRKEVIASTSVVLVIVFLIAAFLGLVDLGLSKMIKLILSRS